jgi:ferredoxin-NADP reductase
MSKLTTKKPSSPAKDAKTTKAANAAPPANSEPTEALPVDAKWVGFLRVGSIISETPHIKTFRMVPSSGDGELPFTFLPGQFLNVAFSIGGARMNRSYSISSSPTHREYVDLTVRREPRGAVSRHIVDLLKVGDQIEAGGPVGTFTFTGT